MTSAPSRARLVSLLGPAIVAGVAYLDPGNVAANITAGARLGFLLVWVVLAGNIIAWIVQYLSASLGIVTGKSLPEVLGERIESRGWRLAYWIQGELIAMATDVAEVIGGAIALEVLAGIPLWLGGVIVGAISLALVGIHGRFGSRPFERVILVLILVTAVGFGVSLWGHPVNAGDILGGLVPRLHGNESLLLASAILGATIMPHAIYAHSGLTRDRFGVGSTDVPRIRCITRIDVTVALVIAGAINIMFLLIGAVVLSGRAGTDTLAGSFAAIATVAGPAVGALCALGLLASSLASTAVGAYAGAEIMHGLVRRRVSPLVRRVATVLPAVLILAVGIEPTTALILSQVVLSWGIPFALVPLIAVTGNARIMGEHRSHGSVRALASVATVLVVVINAGMVTVSLGG